MQAVTLIAGDGVGPEVMRAAREVVLAAGAEIDFREALAGERAFEELGTPLPQATLDSMRATRVALKGPTYTPFGGDYRVRVEGPAGERSYPSVAIALRRELELFASVRPVKSYPGVASRFDAVDLVVFRENSEDLYVGIESMAEEGVAQAAKVITARATERIARFALDYMARLGRRRLTIGHKANVLKLTDGLFLHIARETARAHAAFAVDERVVDALCMELVLRPEQFDCLLLPNLYGDIVSDLAAGLVGGLGIVPGANFGAECAMFEPVHGTAPDLAGRDLANPMAAILSAVMMLRHLGQTGPAGRIEAALAAVLAERRALTPDLGGETGTRAMTEAIVEKLQRL